MSNHQTMSKKKKPLFRGLVAIAVIGMGSIAMVGVKAADPPAAADRGEVQSAEPMVPLPRPFVEGLADAVKLSPELVTNHCVWVTCGTGTCCFRPPH